MDVLTEILKWSASRPGWQRDALRRIVQTSELTEQDIDELTELCKGGHGLSAPIESVPLAKEQLRSPAEERRAVTLSSLTHVGGVNALAPGQRLEFAPGMTVIFGENAAGKSGYTRILKSACRARGSEEILANCLEEAPPQPPRAVLMGKSGDATFEVEWGDDAVSHDVLSQVNVFDSYCAAVYVKDKTDVAFRPFGLDIFDRLSESIERVKRLLERERRSVSEQDPVLPQVAPNTSISRLLGSLSSLTSLDEVSRLATLTSEEELRLETIHKLNQEARAGTRASTIKTLQLRSRRITDLQKHLENLQQTLGAEALADLKKLWQSKNELANAAEALNKATLDALPIKSVATDVWRTLWEAARTYSEAEVYQHYSFPHVGEDARCVLCQQVFDKGAVERMVSLEQHIRSDANQKADQASSLLQDRLEKLQNLVPGTKSTLDAIQEVELESEGLAKQLRVLLDAAESARIATLLNASQRFEQSVVPLELGEFTIRLEELVASIGTRTQALNSERDDKAEAALRKELDELESRATLRTNLQLVVDEIERKKRLAAYELCIKETSTAAITRKSTEITKATVTDQLSAGFAREIKRLKFDHVEVELSPAGGSRGALYHKLELRRARSASLPSIVSEGEARTLSIAAFFAELSTAANPSAIIFDDPVSSLDHLWRERVAARLCEEAKERQVIVFTHDIVFLLALSASAENLGVAIKHQYIRRDPAVGSGICRQELPWVALGVKKRIGVLKAQFQAAEKLERTGEIDRYEREAAYLYGLLRETWERCVEEVLLVGIVQRYRQGIQTQHIGKLSRISEDFCDRLAAGMSKTSRWLPGHDQAPAENTPIPRASELGLDIDELEAWFNDVNKVMQK